MRHGMPGPALPGCGWSACLPLETELLTSCIQPASPLSSGLLAWQPSSLNVLLPAVWLALLCAAGQGL